MAIEDWLGEDGQKTIGVMDWPEWTSRGSRAQLRYDAEYELWELWSRGDVEGTKWGRWRGISDHEALCLLRDRARVFCENRRFMVGYDIDKGGETPQRGHSAKRDASVSPERLGDKGELYWADEYLTVNGEWFVRNLLCREDYIFRNYDAVLIAAILAHVSRL